MSTKTLPALVVEMAEIVAQLQESGGEISPVLEQAMDCTAAELSAKTDRYAFFMERLDIESDYWKAKADEYARVAKSCKALKERLNGSIKAALEVMGQDEIAGNEMRFKLSKLAPKLVLDESRIPAIYKMAVTEYVPDKERIKEDLSNGLNIEGAKLEPVFSLRKYTARKA